MGCRVRGYRFGMAAFVTGLLLLAVSPAGAQETGGQRAPSGGPEGTLRSRLTLTGIWWTEAFSQKNFYLGGRPDTLPSGVPTGYASNHDAFWVQYLNLTPRTILSDNLNVNLSLTLAQGIWGLDNELPDTEQPGYTNLFNKKDTFFILHVDQAYAAYRNIWSKTRWYLGRQRFGPGNMLCLDEDAGGLQVYRDLPGFHSSIGGGYAKVFEGTNGLTDEDFTHFEPDSTRQLRGPDGRDADLFYLEWNYNSPGGKVRFNPFYIVYNDKHAQGDSLAESYLPMQQGYLDARFRPNISTANIIGVAGKLRAGALYLNAELDVLKGKDKIPNIDSDLYEQLDRNNGDLKGRNLLVQAGYDGHRLQLGGVLGWGSGDPDPRADEGNINFLRNQGDFSLLEVWGNGIALDDRAATPQGMGNPFVRSYRGLENMKIYQGGIGFRILENLRVHGSYSLLRTAEAVSPWRDLNGDGRITLQRGTPAAQAEYGYDPNYPDQPFALSTDVGKEMDLQVEWVVDKLVTVGLRGGVFTPGPAAGYIISGTARYQEKATQWRLGVTVPIKEFSLGG